MIRNDLAVDGRMRRRAAWAVTAALAASIAGCGDGGNPLGSASFHPVKGKVSLPDGKPLASVKVIFTGPAIGGATTESDGAFTVKGDRDGLPEGDYRVRLEAPATTVATKKPSIPFPGKYLDEDSSGLTAKVTSAGPNDFDFKLTNDGTPTGARPAPRGH